MPGRRGCVRRGAAVIILVWLAGLVAGSAHAEPLAFAGFDRNMDIAVWIDRYPQSPREFTPRAAARRPRAPGGYAWGGPADEARDHVYYIQADLRDGAMERLWLLLEKPLIR